MFFDTYPHLLGNATQMFLGCLNTSGYGQALNSDLTYTFTSVLVGPNMLMFFPVFSVGAEDKSHAPSTFYSGQGAPVPTGKAAASPRPTHRLTIIHHIDGA